MLEDGQRPVDGLHARSGLGARGGGVAHSRDGSAPVLRITVRVSVDATIRDASTSPTAMTARTRPSRRSCSPCAAPTGRASCTPSPASCVEHGGNIVESQQFDDPADGPVLHAGRFAVDGDRRRSTRCGPRFAPVAERFGMTWELWAGRAPYRTLILVSKRPLPQRPAVPVEQGRAADRRRRRRVEPPRLPSRWPRRTASPFHHIPVTPDDQGRRRGASCSSWSTSSTSTWSCWRATCRCSPTTSAARWRGGRSTSTTRSCRASRARGPTTRPSTAA